MKTPCGESEEHKWHSYPLPSGQIKVCNGIPALPPDSCENSEDVTGHTMFNFCGHDDGRECAYHSRLGKWVTTDENDRYTLECLRSH